MEALEGAAGAIDRRRHFHLFKACLKYSLKYKILLYLQKITLFGKSSYVLITNLPVQ